MRLLTCLLSLLLLFGCTRRAYPAISFGPIGIPQRSIDLELGAATRLSYDLFVAMDEGDPTKVYEIHPDPTVDSASIGSSDPIDVFQFQDTGLDCPRDDTAKAVRCRYRTYRSRVPLVPRPIRWLPDATGKLVLPRNVQDLATFPCEGTCVLGVTEFTTIGRLTKFREDQVARGRDETERLFVLKRTQHGWEEIRVPAVERLRERLSDWGRAQCREDMIVEGLAVDPAKMHAYVGIRRCDGWSHTVLRYPIGEAMNGQAAQLLVVADDIEDQGLSLAGPTEGLSSLDWAHGHLWATSSWDDWGSSRQPVYGSRMLVLHTDHLHPVPLPAEIADRADALVVLPGTRTSPSPDDLFPDIHALLLFDNDRRSGPRNATLVHAFTPKPSQGRFVGLRSLGLAVADTTPVGLNGFDFHWFLRDHRLGQLTVLADHVDGRTGGWTAALGGLWQVRLGAMARVTKPVLGKAVGHNRQAIAVTDYAAVPELDFTAYRAVLSVIPRERTGQDVSIAQVMAATTRDFELEVELPEVAPGTGLVLQGFTLDTASRAAGGICLSAMDLGVKWVDPEHPGKAILRAQLLGGLCNDFNAQDPEEHHGLTTEPRAGVRVVLYFATVEGGQARTGSVAIGQRDRPGDRERPGSITWVDDPRPEPAPYRRPTSPDRIGNHTSKDNVACVRVDGDTLEAVEPPKHRYLDPAQSEWLVKTRGELPEGRAEHRGGSLSGFAFALDLRSFDPEAPDETWADITPLAARSQNVYLYRYLLRAWAEQGVFVEGGMSHGVHMSGPGKDNALPTAAFVRADLTWWDDLSADPADRDVTPPIGRYDANLQPEDGFLRWARTSKRDEELTCLEH